MSCASQRRSTPARRCLQASCLLLVLGVPGLPATRAHADEPAPPEPAGPENENECTGAGGMGLTCLDDEGCAAHAFATVCINKDPDDESKLSCEVPCGTGASPVDVADPGRCGLGEVCTAAADDTLYCKPTRFRMDLNLLDLCVAQFVSGTPPVLGRESKCSLEANLGRLLDQTGDLLFDLFDVRGCVLSFLEQPVCDPATRSCPAEIKDLVYCDGDEGCGPGLFCDPAGHFCTRECGVIASREPGFGSLERQCAGRLKRCDETRGRCVPAVPEEATCTVDAQCPAGAYCFLGRCAPTCGRGLDCPDSGWFCTESGRCRIQPAPAAAASFRFEPELYSVLFGASSVTLTLVEDEQQVPLLIMDLVTKREVRNNPAVGFGYRLEVAYGFKQEEKCLESTADWGEEQRADCLIDPSEEFVTPLSPFGAVFAAGQPAVHVRLNRAAAERLSPGTYVATVNAIFDNGNQDRFEVLFTKQSPSGKYTGTMTVALGRPENSLGGRTPLTMALRLQIRDEQLTWDDLLRENNLAPAGAEDVVDLTQGLLVVGKLLAGQTLPYAWTTATDPANNEVPVKGLYAPRSRQLRLIGVVDLPAEFCIGEDGPCDARAPDELRVVNVFGRSVRRVFQLFGTFDEATHRYYGIYRERLSGLVPVGDLTLDGAFLLDQSEFDPSDLSDPGPLLSAAAPESIAFPGHEAVLQRVQDEIDRHCRTAAGQAALARFASAAAYGSFLASDFPVLPALVRFEELVAEALAAVGDEQERSADALTLYDYLSGWIVPCGAAGDQGVLGQGSPAACVDAQAASCGLALQRKALLSGFVPMRAVGPAGSDQQLFDVGPAEAGELPLFCSAVIPVEGCRVHPVHQPALATLYEHNRFHQELSQANKFLADRDISDAFFTHYRHQYNPFARGEALSYKAERLRAAFATYGELLDLFLAPEAASVLFHWPMEQFQGQGDEWLRQMQIVLADRLEVQRQLVDLRRRLFANTERSDELLADHLAQQEYLIQVYLLALQRSWQGPSFTSTGRSAEAFASLQQLSLQLSTAKNPLGMAGGQVFFESSDPARPNWRNYLARLIGDDGRGGLLARARSEVQVAVDNLRNALRDVDALEERLVAAQLAHEDRLTELCGPEAMSDVENVCDRMLAWMAALRAGTDDIDPTAKLDRVCAEAKWSTATSYAQGVIQSPPYVETCKEVGALFHDNYDGEAVCPLMASENTILVRGKKRVCIGGQMGRLLQQREELRVDLAGMAQPILRSWEEIHAYLLYNTNQRVIAQWKLVTTTALWVVKLVVKYIASAVDSSFDGLDKVAEGAGCVVIFGFSVGTDCPQKIGSSLLRAAMGTTKSWIVKALEYAVDNWDKITAAALVPFNFEEARVERNYLAFQMINKLGPALGNFGVLLQKLADVELQIIEIEYQAQYSADRLDKVVGLTLDHLVGRESGSVLASNHWVGESAKTFAELLDTTYRMTMAFTHRYNLPAAESAGLIERVYQAVTIDDVQEITDTLLDYERSYCGREAIDCDAFNNLSVMRFSVRDELFPQLRDIVDPASGKVVTRGEQFHNLITSPPYLRRRVRGTERVDQIELPFTVWLKQVQGPDRPRWLLEPTQCNQIVDADPILAAVAPDQRGTMAVNFVGLNLSGPGRSIGYELVRGHSDWLRACHPEAVVEEVGTAPVVRYPIRTQVVGYAPQSVQGMQPSPPTYVIRSGQLPACINSAEERGVLPAEASCWRYFARDRSLAAPDYMLVIPLAMGGADTGNGWIAGEGQPAAQRPIIEDIVLYVRYRSRPIQDY